MSRNGKNGNNRITGGFVMVSLEMMDHAAFRLLSEGALRVLLHCIRKTNRKDVDRHDVIFTLTYPEAKKRLGLADATFARGMRRLHQVGFVDYYSPGGLRRDGKAAKGYKLSRRWKQWGTTSFEHRHEGHYESIKSHSLKDRHNTIEKRVLSENVK